MYKRQAYLLGFQTDVESGSECGLVDAPFPERVLRRSGSFFIQLHAHDGREMCIRDSKKSLDDIL